MTDEELQLILDKANQEYLDQEKGVIGQTIDIVSDTYQALPEPVQDVAEAAGQGAMIAGSKFMDWIAPLAKPWGAVAGAWDAVGEFAGPRIYYNEETGKLDISYFEDARPDDERSKLERVQEGVSEGWEDPFTKNIGDEFSSLLSPDFLDTTTGRIVGGAIELVANIASDPLNIFPSRVFAIPYRLAKKGTQWLANSRAGKATLEAMPVRTVLQAMNVYTGDAAKAKKIIDTLKRKERGATVLANREEAFLNKELGEIAKKAGVSVDDLKAAILQEVEAGTIASGRLAAISPDAATFAENERKIMEEILRAEGVLGTADILTPKRMKELSIGGYYPHVLNKTGATMGERVANWYNRALPPSMYRELEGTIAQINARMGRDLLLKDPVALRVLRQKWSRQALGAHRLYDDAKVTLGTKVGRVEKVEGGRPIYFDEAGTRLPDDFIPIEGMEGYVFPKEGARVLEDFFGTVSKPINLPKQFDAAIRGFDAVQNWWKKYTLGLRPAWHTRNAFSNFWNNWFIGGLKNPLRYGQAAAVQKAMQYKKGFFVGGMDEAAGKLTGKAIDPKAKVKGTEMTREEIWDAAVESGVYEAGFYGADIPGQVGKSSRVPFATQGRTINKAFAAGKAVENNARLALFIERLAKGDSVEDAASMVRKALFDYADLSAFEREGLKRLMPFYTWTRKNIPAQLFAILEHPDRANKLNLMFGTAQEGVPKLDTEDIEKWAKDQFPIVLDMNSTENVYTFITAMATLPTAELNRVFTDPKTAANFMAQMGTPLLKVPLELWANLGTFRNEPLDKLEQRGNTYGFDWSQGIITKLPPKQPGETFKEYALRRLRTGSETFLGINVTPKQKHILQSIVLLGEIDRANPWSVFGVQGGEKSWAGVTRDQKDLSPAARLIRAALGGRIYQREKGSVKSRKVLDLTREVDLLTQELSKVENARNPAQLQHVLYLLGVAKDKLKEMGGGGNAGYSRLKQ